MPEASALSLRQLIEAQCIVPHFQPIAALGDGAVLGYEALARGPEGHPLRMPAELFRVARAEGCTVELELHCARVAMRAFARSGARGKLWINLGATALRWAAAGHHGDLLAAIRLHGLLPSRLVIELTEDDRIDRADELRGALAPFRRAGIGLALDDFGDGRSSLRVWTELRPDYVKIDKHFVRGLQASNDRFEVVRVIGLIAETLGGALVAEGIEAPEDLAVLRDMGVAWGQGFLLGRPAAEPVAAIAPEALQVVRSATVTVFPEIRDRVRDPLTARSLLIDAAPVTPATTHEELAQRFRLSPQLHAVAVVDGGRPVGIVNRQAFVDRYAQPFYREIYGRRPCTVAMNEAPLVIEAGTPLMGLIEVLRGQDQRYLVDGFILCDEGRYAGLGTGEHLVRAVSELRIEAARHANPLTSLPGNIPITEHIQRLIERRVPFVACYCDLRNFKPFNDVYGYWRGDEMIRLVASLLLASADSLRDFVGHVGGDDFVVLMQSPDWRERVRRLIDEFNERAQALYDDAALARGGIESEDRKGHPAFFPFTTLVVGATVITPGDFPRAEDVASAAAHAKRGAKHAASGLAISCPQGDGCANPLCADPECVRLLPAMAPRRGHVLGS